MLIIIIIIDNNKKYVTHTLYFIVYLFINILISSIKYFVARQ